MPRVQLSEVTKYFGEKLVLDQVDLSVDLHEVICRIGASGSGKSTLLRCINRLVKADYGDIYLDDVPVTDQRFGKVGLHKRIGIVFQSYNLFPHLTVLDNLTLAPRKVHGKSRKDAEGSALEQLDRFGMNSFAKAYPEQLSGGQQQRVAFVRALMNKPDVLLLDEVTAALDPELVGEVLGIIKELKAQGMTMVIVTHEMGFARDVADRVCFLEGGRILEEGDPNRMFSDPQHERTRAFLDRIIEAGRL